MSQTYRTAPVETTRMPPGIAYIVGNEAAERFSFYGMKAILFVYMTRFLLNSAGQKDTMSDDAATEVYHWFNAANYALPILGALLSDLFLGKYRTIIGLSLVYCLGHVALAIDETRLGLYVGLGLIAVGSGGIKPCVSAHVGDQFTSLNKHLLERVYGWFYFSVNFGSFFSTLLTPYLLDHPSFGPRWAFGIPGVLMGLATLVFWWGRKEYAHIPPRGAGFLREAWSPEGRRILLRLSLICLFISVFWSLYDQTGSKWVDQAERMDRVVKGSLLWREFRFELSASQLQAVNPILVMVFIPLFTLVIYPAVGRFMTVTPLGKMCVGFFVTVASFALSGWIEVRLQAGESVHIYWQVLAYVLMTVAELLVYFSSLEFSYTQAPPTMKSFVMALNVLSVSLGNIFTALVNWLIQRYPSVDQALDGARYYWFFSGVMLLAAIIFIYVAFTYQGKTYLQDSEGLDTEASTDTPSA